MIRRNGSRISVCIHLGANLVQTKIATTPSTAPSHGESHAISSAPTTAAVNNLVPKPSLNAPLFTSNLEAALVSMIPRPTNKLIKNQRERKSSARTCRLKGLSEVRSSKAQPAVIAKVAVNSRPLDLTQFTASVSCMPAPWAGPPRRPSGGACLPRRPRSCPRTIRRGCCPRRRGCAWPDGRGRSGRG